MKSKDLYPAIFSRHAEAYERRLEQVMSRGESRGRQRAIELLEATPGMRILDLACGPGNIAARLSPLVAPGGEVVGIDLAPGMIERARARRLAGASFEVMDIERLDFPDVSFDAAICGHGLQFAADLPRALGEVRRVLRQRARFTASVPVGSPSKGVQDVLDGVVDRHLPPAPKPVGQDATRTSVSDPDRFAAAAQAAGFGPVRVETIDERIVWESAEQLVAMCSSWWDCAARLDCVDAGRRDAFIDDAVAALRRSHPGRIETFARNLVLVAVA